MKRFLKFLFVCITIIGVQAFAQITGKTNIGSLGPPAALKIYVNFSEPSGNNILDAGEKGVLKVVVFNIGGRIAEGVKVNLSPIPQLNGVTFTYDKDLGSIDPNKSKEAIFELVSDSTLISQKVNVSVQAFTVSGIKADPKTLELVTRERPKVPILMVTSKFIEPSGNSLLDAGEVGSIRSTVTNIGNASAKNIVARLIRSDQTPDIIATPRDSIGEIAVGASSTAVFQLKAMENISTRVINFVVEVSSSNMNSMSINPVYVQDIWQHTNGPYGGTINAFAVSPNGAGGTNLFAGTSGGGVFLSTNNGTSWTAVNTGLTSTTVLALAVSGTNLFAGTSGGGVFLSTNNGTSWTAVNIGLRNTSVSALAVSGTILFAGTSGGGVFLSTNNGTSWTAVNTGLTNATVRALAVSGPNLFAGTEGGGVFLSTNNGTSWTAVNTGLTNTTVLALAVSGTILFAGTSGGVFLSTNNGTSWTAINTGLTSTSVRALAVSGTNLFAGTSGGVFLSINNGTSWTAVNTGLTSTSVLALAVSDTNLFAGTNGGVFLSTNHGTSWTTVNTGLTSTYVRTLTVSGTNLFAGTYGGCVFLSTNNGTSWTALNTGMTNTYVRTLTVSGTNLFAGTNDGVFLSTNNGTSWTAVTAGLTNTFVNSLAVSSNGAGGTNLFAGTNGGVFLSTNNGRSWTAVNTGLTNTTVLDLAVSPNGAGGTNLFAGTNGGVFLSTNNGRSWTAVNTGLTNTTVLDLAVSPNGTGGTNLFAGTSSGGIFLSTNNGRSWIATNTGLTRTSVRALVVSPNGVGGTNLFAGTSGGVFLSTNNGTSWAAIDTGLTNTFVHSLAVSGGSLFAGTDGGGVFRYVQSTMAPTIASFSPLRDTIVNSIARDTLVVPTRERVIARNETPLTIEILEPVEFAKRGMKVPTELTFVTTSSSLKLRGLAKDSSGVERLFVNGDGIQFKTTTIGAEFSYNALLALGNNEIEIKAVAKAKNESSLKLLVRREMGLVKGRYYALTIGVNKYRGVWPELKNAVHDAKGVADQLQNNYRFDKIIALYDDAATRAGIIQQFEWLADTLTPEDNLLIYYSGHGEFKENLNKGYWVPVDAKERSTVNYISNSDILTFLKGIRTKHTILISDACFAGDIFRGKTESIPFENSERYFQEVYKRPSRQAITSGGVEPVMDGGREGHSVFTYYFLKALRENTLPYFDAGQLYERLKIPVSNNSDQTPVFSAIKNTDDEGGQFIFIRK